VATAFLLVRWGKKKFDNRTGLFAAAIFVAGLHIAIIGRVATADMAMVFFFTLAAWSGWELTRPESSSRKSWWWIFYISLALGFLAKGPEAWLPFAGLLLGRMLRKNSFRLPLLETIAGLIVTCALTAAWGIPALMQTHGQYLNVGLGEHVVFRSVGVIDGHGVAGALGFIALLPLYFVTFFVSFFPWSTRIPGSLRSWWPTRKRDDFGWYLLLQVLIVFAVFSCVRTKLPHYTIPAFPLIALWFARQIANEKNSTVWFGKRIIAMTILIFVITLGLFPIARNYLLTENLWHSVKPYVHPETKIACLGYTEPSLVWKFRSISTNLVTLGSVKLAADFLTNPPPFILVLPTQDLNHLPDTNGLCLQVHGLDMVKFRNRNLSVLVR
jgi:4-amino-4-deoxy-L-arabinose transferase-like glycosyltransferase